MSALSVQGSGQAFMRMAYPPRRQIATADLRSEGEADLCDGLVESLYHDASAMYSMKGHEAGLPRVVT